MKPALTKRHLLLAIALLILAGCANKPMTREQKEQQALSKAYEAITSGKPSDSK